MANNESKEVVKVQSVKGVDITPVLTEVVEYAKDQASVGDLESIISSVPRKDSLDWKLISGVLCNSIVEWIAEDKDLVAVHNLWITRARDLNYPRPPLFA